MTGKFVILFLHKNEAEKKIKWPPFELPTNFKKRDHISCSSFVIAFTFLNKNLFFHFVSSPSCKRVPTTTYLG